MTPDVFNFWYSIQLGATSILFMVLAVRLIAIRRPLIVPGWLVTLVLFSVILPAPSVGVYMYLFHRRPGMTTLTLVGLGLLLWVIYRVNRGYHFLGASEASVSTVLDAAVASGRLRHAEDRTSYELPVPGASMLIRLQGSAGITKMTVTPWAHHARVRDLVQWTRAFYNFQSSPNSVAAEAWSLITALIVGTFAVLMYGVA